MREAKEKREERGDTEGEGKGGKCGHMREMHHAGAAKHAKADESNTKRKTKWSTAHITHIPKALTHTQGGEGKKGRLKEKEEVKWTRRPDGVYGGSR